MLMMMSPKEILLFLLAHKWKNVMTPLILIQTHVSCRFPFWWKKDGGNDPLGLASVWEPADRGTRPGDNVIK